MTAVAFDTLKLARRLESAGFTHDQADGAAAALAETFSGEIATRSDIAGVQGEIAALRTELKGDIAKLGGDLRGEIASLRSTTAQGIISAVFVNILTVIGAVAAVWQLAHR